MLARDNSMTFEFSRGVTVGVYSDSLAGIASLLAAVVILILIFHRIYVTSTWEALDVSVIALFVAEVIQGIGHAMGLKWVIEGGAHVGAFCNAQGIFRQLGGTAAAIFTLTVAVQTFLIVWRLKVIDRKWIVVLTILQSILVFLMTIISFGISNHPSKSKYFEIPTPYWCWIGSAFFGQRIGLEYAWFWLTALGSLMLYIPLFLLHFRIIRPGKKWYSPAVNVRWQSESPQLQGNSHHAVEGSSPKTEETGIATNPAQVLSGRDGRLWSAILYPLLYCVYIIPVSAYRLPNFYSEFKTGKGTPNPRGVLVSVVFLSLSGVLNAILYRMTRSIFFQPVLDPPRAPPVHPTA